MTNEEFLRLNKNTFIFDTTKNEVYAILFSKLESNGKIKAKMKIIGEDREAEIVELESVENYADITTLQEGMNPYEFAAFKVMIHQINSNMQSIIHCISLCENEDKRKHYAKRKYSRRR